MNLFSAKRALIFCGLTASLSLSAAASAVDISIDPAKTDGDIDLTRYALGQGGLSEKPMFAAHVEQIKQLHPQTIRVFIQEFFHFLPEHDRYYWKTFDDFVESILATGAKPILSLCFKPKLLFPKIDQHVVHPNDYIEWEKLISKLVEHCAAKKYGIEYWEVSNEPDIGEDGGCPFLFQKEDYVIFYQHTVAAVRRADPKAKVGGPALAWYKSEIADALIQHCGKNETPLDFFSWHVYQGDPEFFRKSIRDVKAKLAQFPKLKNCETIIDEWNMSLDQPNLDPAFQPAFILQTTYIFHEEGLSRSAYYHIRDWFVDKEVFSRFMSPAGAELVARWWNVVPQYDGLWDHQGRVRPSYEAFKLLSQIRGQKIKIENNDAEIKVLAAKNESAVNVLAWNFSLKNKSEAREVTLHFPPNESGTFREYHFDAADCANQLKLVRQGSIADLKSAPLKLELRPLEVRWVFIH